MAAIPSYKKWIADTSSLTSPRSALLKNLDERIAGYESSPNSSNRENIRGALNRWIAEQTRQNKDWKTSVRNKKGAVTELYRALNDDDRNLTAADYEDDIAVDPRIDELRAKIDCVEEPRFTADYHDPEKRSIANSLRMELNDGTILEETVEYPIGHRRRREEGMPLLVEKFKTNLRRRFTEAQQQRILDASLDRHRLDAMPVSEYVDLYVP